MDKRVICIMPDNSIVICIVAIGKKGSMPMFDGSTGADPAFSTVTSSDGSISFTTGAHTLSITGTAASTTQVGSVELATNAEVTTGTSTTLVPSVASMVAHQGIVKAWVKHNMAAGIQDSYNVSSVTDTGTGQATINYTTAFANANYAISALALAASNINALVNTQSTGSVLIEYRGTILGTLTDPTNGYVICIGDQ